MWRVRERIKKPALKKLKGGERSSVQAKRHILLRKLLTGGANRYFWQQR